MRRKSSLVTGRVGLILAGTVMFALSAEAWSQVSEIIVTTRKRAENLQEVPVAVQAISAEDIERRGLTSLKDVVRESPSVILDQGFAPQDQRIVIRGLSPTRGRQNAAVLIDDIDISSESIVTSGGSLLINPQLFDMERIEIVKGPQNALYGRSAFAGAINYITKKPGDEFEASAGTDIGSEGQLMIKGALSGPLSDSLNAGINATHWDDEGFYTNSITGQTAGGKDGTGVAGALVWKAADGLKVTGRIENLNDHFDVTPYVMVRFPTGSVPNPATPQFNTTYPVQQTAGDGHSVWCVPVCPGAAGTLAPVIRGATFPGSVIGIGGSIPDGDTQTLALSEDPRTCPETYPSSLAGCSNYPGTDRDVTRYTLTVDWDAGPVDFKSLSHYAHAKTHQQEGSEDVSAATATAVGVLDVRNDTDLLSQEFRVLSKREGPLNWTAGALYWREKTTVQDGSSTCLNYTGFPFLSGSCGPYLKNILDTGLLPLGSVTPLADASQVPLNPAYWDRSTDHFSVYGLVEWQFLEQWKVAVEARQAWEQLQLQGPNAGNGLWDPSGTYPCAFGPPFIPCPSVGPGTIDLDGPGPGGFSTYAAGLTDKDLGTVDDHYLAPKATLTWTPTGDQLYYFSWGESFKPKGITPFTGGAGAFDPVGNSFDQEKLQTWELGAKTSWLDRRLIANLTAFYEDFKNKQVSTQVQIESPAGSGNYLLVPRTVNAGKAEVKGVELELVWAPTDDLRFNLAYTWLDTEYKDYLNTSASVGTIGYVGDCSAVVASSTTPIATGAYAGQLPSACVNDYSGNKLEGAPDNSLVGGAHYQRPLVGGTDWFLEGDFQYQDDRFANDQNTMTLPSYWLFNFRAGVSNDKWDVIGYVDNAFDDDTIKTGFADGDVPTFQTTTTFLNHATVILPDPRIYGLRVNYRFGGE